MAGVVLDASALLALLRDGPSADEVARVLDKAIISAVDLQEVWKELLASGVPPDVAREITDELGLTVRPHNASAAWASAQLGPFATPTCSSET